MKKKRFRKLRIVLIILLVMMMIGSFVAIEYVFPGMIVYPYRYKVEDHLKQFPNGTSPADYHLQFEPLDVRTKDSLLLKGYFIHAKNDSAKATIIIIHGIGACKEQMLSFTAHLSEEGFNTMIFDLRAQGQSEGTFCTYGFYEKEDVSIIIDSLIRRNATQPFGIWGSSLGGAVALQSLAFDQRLKFGIIESTFDELDHVVLEYSNDLLHFKSKWMCCVSLDKAGKLAHFNPAEVKPVEACKQITQPVMIAHGLRDEKIPIEFDRRNFAALAGAEKEFVEVPGAGHLNLQTVGGDDYFEKMVSFINLHLQK